MNRLYLLENKDLESSVRDVIDDYDITRVAVNYPRLSSSITLYLGGQFKERVIQVCNELKFHYNIEVLPLDSLDGKMLYFDRCN